MGIPFRELWQLFKSEEAIATSAEAAQAVFDLAATIQEQGNNSSRIQELASKIPTLLEVLNSPLGQIVNSTVPFLPIAVGIINCYREATKKEPTHCANYRDHPTSCLLGKYQRNLKAGKYFSS